LSAPVTNATSLDAKDALALSPSTPNASAALCHSNPIPSEELPEVNEEGALFAVVAVMPCSPPAPGTVATCEPTAVPASIRSNCDPSVKVKVIP
jgi:hypothetical protein